MLCMGCMWYCLPRGSPVPDLKRSLLSFYRKRGPSRLQQYYSRGITLLSVLDKVFAHLLVMRIQFNFLKFQSHKPFKFTPGKLPTDRILELGTHLAHKNVHTSSSAHSSNPHPLHSAQKTPIFPPHRTTQCLQYLHVVKSPSSTSLSCTQDGPAFGYFSFLWNMVAFFYTLLSTFGKGITRMFWVPGLNGLRFLPYLNNISTTKKENLLCQLPTLTRPFFIPEGT